MLYDRIKINLLASAVLMSLWISACDNDSIPIPRIEVVPEDTGPAWSPDGRRIAYWRLNPDVDDSSNVTGLYVLDIESGERHLVAKSFARNPDWSPDGERIAFNAGDIFSIRPDGTDLRRLTTHGSAFFPAWSPDGLEIAYDATPNFPNVPVDSAGIWPSDKDGRNRKHLGLGRNPDWSPDGGQLVYQGPPGATDAGGQIWTADTSGVDPIQVTHNGFIGNRSPAWSPDGEWIAWTTLKGPAVGLWVMRADGTEPHELVERPLTEDDVPRPSWSPDSRRLVFNWPAPSGDRVVLWTIGRDGSGMKQLSH